VALGKEILPQVVFQGGVAFNQGIIKALEEALDVQVLVPPHHELMGAIGAALLLHEEFGNDGHETNFKGFEVSQTNFTVSSFICKACPNLCEIAQISMEGNVMARWGGRCDLWERAATS
jgi:hypothetical protein